MDAKSLKVTAIVLAGGSGKRMNSNIQKQYMEIGGMPILAHTLKVFQKSNVDEIVLVSAEKEYCISHIIKPYGITKVTSIVPGGSERYHSVFNGLKEVSDEGIVLIHDGARPFVSHNLIERCINGAKEYCACVAAVSVKDTIKVVSAEGFATHTPDRKELWSVQTPQAFQNKLIKDAYKKIMKCHNLYNITDDAMIVESVTEVPVKIVEGEYTNIKITTPDDLLYGESILNAFSK